MTPLRIDAILHTPMVRTGHPMMLDALLMHRVATIAGLPPLDWQDERGPEPEIPIAKSACGRLYLASQALFEVETHEKFFVNKRFPMKEAQAMSAPSVKSILVGGGLSKGWRIPRERVHLVDDRITWFALGDRERIEELLETATHIGPRRGVGNGRVREWNVKPVEAWEGFPVLRAGSPLRALPFDWPGLGEHRIEWATLSPPYWERHRERECAVPL